MKVLAEDEAKLIAVAQHFGIPTDYVDFSLSPAIACLFSRDREQSSNFESNDSCIYCLNLNSMVAWFKSLTPEEAVQYQIYPVTVILPELHRLHAQLGLFLHAPNDWYKRFEPDCILFPRGPVLNDAERLSLYPPTSHLEEVLQAFKQANDTEEVAEFVRRQGGSVVRMRPPATSIRDSCFKTTVPAQALWQNDKALPWMSGRFRSYIRPYVVKYPTQTVRMGNVMFGEALRHQLEETLSGDMHLWEVPLRFDFEPTNGLLEEAESICMSDALTRAWNGMASFPYSHDDLLDCFQRIVFLATSRITSRSPDIEAKLTRMLSQPAENKDRWIKVYMQSRNGASSEGLCSYSELVEALRADLPEFLSPEGLTLASTDPLELIRRIRDPSMIFDFRRLLSSFTENLIPTQSLLNRSDQPIIFSPAQVTDLWPRSSAT